MSADNYLLIRHHPRGGYAVVMGFASDDVEPVVREDQTSYATLEAAVLAAAWEQQTKVVEYGIQIHPEVRPGR